jgi:phospholipid/cholesterol/gamma-HCH transport system permease protein
LQRVITMPSHPAAEAPAGRVHLSGRFMSRRRVAVGSVYWLGWLIGSPRTFVSTGFGRELDAYGVRSLRLVGSASVLVGLIATFQLAYQLHQFSAEAMTAKGVAWFAWRELGPIVVALLVVTRSASAIAGELAAMTANAEIDALRAMGLDPIKYLVAPKLAALLVALPALTIISDGMITVGAWIGNVFFLRSNTAHYLEEVRNSAALRDISIGVGKAFLFSFVIAIIAADEGLNVDRRVGAIGEATTRAVVFCLLGVLATDTFINAVFYFIPGLVF